jgi:hypothetical protein
MTNKRNAPRQRVLKAGTITFGGEGIVWRKLNRIGVTFVQGLD